MWKAKVKDQLLACAIAFMWTWSEHTDKTEGWYLWPKTASEAWACAHVKFTGAHVKIMWKAKVKDQLLVCAIAFMWMWSETERVVFGSLRSDLKSIKNSKSFPGGSAPQLCYVRTECTCAVPTYMQLPHPGYTTGVFIPYRPYAIPNIKRIVDGSPDTTPPFWVAVYGA